MYKHQIVSHQEYINTFLKILDFNLEILLTLSQVPMQVSTTIKITIHTINNTYIDINIQNTLTGYQLKQFIYKNVTQSLQAIYMKLYYAGVKIQDDKTLSAYKMVQGKQIKLIQTKIDIDQIPGLIVSYQQDQITLEDKTARMPCGHVIGRDCMTQFIRSLVSSNLYKIVCPSYKPNGERCQNQWDFALCRKIGVFTNEQIVEFQTGLSKNWILQTTIECPNCKENLYKGDLQINRVRCPRCKYGDFCVYCCKKWIGKNNDICGNEGCQIIGEYLQKSPWNRKFNLYDKDKKKIEIIGPLHRVCPKCLVLIQHTGGCKHMQCKNCKFSFCWVCLSLYENNKWKCGSYSDYCGTIAQVQKINNDILGN